MGLSGPGVAGRQDVCVEASARVGTGVFDYTSGHVYVRVPVWQTGRMWAHWYSVCAVPSRLPPCWNGTVTAAPPWEETPASESGLAHPVSAVIKQWALQKLKAERAQHPLLRPVVPVRRRAGGPAVHPRRLRSDSPTSVPP